jgi:hypothetical protein
MRTRHRNRLLIDEHRKRPIELQNGTFDPLAEILAHTSNFGFVGRPNFAKAPTSVSRERPSSGKTRQHRAHVCRVLVFGWSTQSFAASHMTVTLPKYSVAHVRCGSRLIASGHREHEPEPQQFVEIVEKFSCSRCAG